MYRTHDTQSDGKEWCRDWGLDHHTYIFVHVHMYMYIYVNVCIEHTTHRVMPKNEITCGV